MSTYTPMTEREMDVAIACISNYILMLGRDLRSGELEPDTHKAYQADLIDACQARAKLEEMR